MDNFKAPWRWDAEQKLVGTEAEGKVLFRNLRDGHGGIIMSSDNGVIKENADIIAAAPLLLKASCRAYNYLMNTWPKEGIPDVRFQQYRNILEVGLKQAGMDLDKVIAHSY